MVEVISTTLKACLGVLPILLILGLPYSSVLKKHGTVPLLREHSHKSGIVLVIHVII